MPVLVMELVEGETLAERLRRGALPWREAVTVAHQIALALEAAHEKGVLHRDLKPPNIRLARDGHVKLLDFGLAKAVRKAAVDSRLDTETSLHSEPGTVLGTAPYMSPEQARGQEPDRRGDIWAFGCVLYEMLAGKRAFAGATYSDTVAAVLDREPDWKALPQETPPALVRLLRRCLQKEKEKRLRDIGDARLELEELLAGPALTEEFLREPRRSVFWPAVALLGALVGGLVSWAVHRSLSARKEVMRLSVETSGASGALLLSPTGDRIVYRTPAGLAVRELDKPEGRVVAGTANARFPFFSPDGHWVGFNDRADGTLKKVSLSGGAPLTLCKMEESHGATWGPDDTEGVQSASGTGVPFFAVARTGMLAYLPQERSAERLVLVDRAGEARPLTPWGGPVSEPRLSPDGRVIALTMPGANDQVWRFDIEREALSQVTFEWDNNGPVWTPDGEFLSVSSTPGWTLRRVRADGSGTPEPLLPASRERIPYSVSADGERLAYTERGASTREDIWIMPLRRDAPRPGGTPLRGTSGSGGRG